VPTPLKLIAIGNAAGVILPDEMLARLQVERGDSLFAVETPGGYLLTPYDSCSAQQLEVGRRFMKEYPVTFRELAGADLD